MPDLTTYRRALDMLRAAVTPRPAVTLALDAAAGLCCAADATSRVDVPDFDNAAMDGFAVRAAELDQAAGGHRDFVIKGRVAAGDRPGERLPAGTAMEIMTGAPVPDGCDAVVPVERSEVATAGTPARVSFNAPVAPGANIRRAGEDFRRGTVVVAAGTRLGPAQLMALAAAGLDEISVREQPRVAVLTTGAELATAGAPTGTGRIRDANGPYLRAALPLLGGRPGPWRHATDSADELTAAAAALLADAEVLISTGGVSAGRYDLVPAAVQALGGEVLFHKLAIRPGKPVLCARLPGGRWWFGLPGNPMAVAVGLRFLVSPALQALQGEGPERPVLARTLGPVTKRPGPRFFAKACVTADARGQLQVEILPGQESFRILPLTRANGWAMLDEGTETLAAGTLVPVLPLWPGGLPAPAFSDGPG